MTPYDREGKDLELIKNRHSVKIILHLIILHHRIPIDKEVVSSDEVHVHEDEVEDYPVTLPCSAITESVWSRAPELELSLPLPVEDVGELNIPPPDNEFDDDERLTVFSSSGKLCLLRSYVVVMQYVPLLFHCQLPCIVVALYLCIA